VIREILGRGLEVFANDVRPTTNGERRSDGFLDKKFGVSNGGQAATPNPVSQVLW